MKRVMIVPLLDVPRFHGAEVICREGTLAALVADTVPGRTRAAYNSDDAFLEDVALGYADRYTFKTLEEAAVFARAKLDELARAGKEIEDRLRERAGR